MDEKTPARTILTGAYDNNTKRNKRRFFLNALAFEL